MLHKTIDMPSNRKAHSGTTLVSQTLQELKDQIQLLNQKNQNLRATIKKHADFRKFVGKTFHDIQSPLLSVRALADAHELPEQKRVALKSAVISIMDINNEILQTIAANDLTHSKNLKLQWILESRWNIIKFADGSKFHSYFIFQGQEANSFILRIVRFYNCPDLPDPEQNHTTLEAAESCAQQHHIQCFAKI